MYLFEEAKANKRTLFVLGKLINVLRYKRFKKKKCSEEEQGGTFYKND